MIRRLQAYTEILIILVFALLPLVISMPYRVNIFLSWEGAYRMSHGQLPFKDFGTPLGGMYWAIPALFFKLFGPKMITLVKAQAFINILAGLSFLSILRSLSVPRGLRVVSVLLFCISYSFFNFWPWYNHSVIVYELMGLACLFRAIAPEGGWETLNVAGGRRRAAWLAGGAFFLVCSLLTKQDAGGIALLIALALLVVYGLLERTVRPLLVFAGSYIVLFLLVILPVMGHGFGYWFNHGQPPHSARVSVFDIAEAFFTGSDWIKFYLLLIVVLAIARYRNPELLRRDKKMVLLLVLAICILGEAAIFQVTSYTPPDNNIFFHSFAVPCILLLLAAWVPGHFESRGMALILSVGILVWWSPNWWKYTQRIFARARPAQATVSPTGENIVNKDTYMISTDTVKEASLDQWVECGLPSFSRIKMPAPTADGIKRLMASDLVRNGGGGLHVLNMSELTPLAADMPYKLERNGNLPLWYHLGVGMFNRQADSFETRIRDHYYDLVLFEYVPTLNNFYPFRVRDSLRLDYSQVDSFPAPRRGAETRGIIEVFVRPVRRE